MKKVLYSLLVAASLFFVACSNDDEIPMVDNTANFEATELGVDANEASVVFKVGINRAESTTISAIVDVSSLTLAYGTHYTISPAPVNGSVTIEIPAGQTTANIMVSKVAGTFFDPADKIEFKIASVTQPCVVGAKANLTLSFTAITSQGSSLRLEGGTGGSSAINSVFVDLSANKQTSVERKSWDFGFYAQADDYRVIINYATCASTKMINKTDLTTVTAQDTVGLSNTLKVAMGGNEGANMTVVDDVNGDITKTAMVQVSATDANNKVYIVNPGVGGGAPVREWLKIRVLRKGEGYTLQYAKLSETTIKTIDVVKNSAGNFQFVSCETGAMVEVEPNRAKWDIVWTYGTLPFLNEGKTLPFPYSDLVYCNNLAGVKVAEVMTSTVSYDDFAAANVTANMFDNSTRATIAGNWRTTPMGTGIVGSVKKDRFYVIKDSAGNIYKLSFVSFISTDGGERGYPNIKYQLVK